MEFDIVTAFPPMVEGPLSHSIVRRARDRGLITVRLHDLRDYAEGRHRKVDDVPYGGGGGMVFMPAPLFAAVEAVRANHPARESRTILLSPQGKRFDQDEAKRLAGYGRLILICGRYEGVDERVREHLVDEEISIGDYVLTGGEIPALVLIDSMTRLIPGALGDEGAARNDSFFDGRLDHPHYTRPADFRGYRVPDVLLSGDHARIAAWRRAQVVEVTKQKRPDLLQRERHGSGTIQEH